MKEPKNYIQENTPEGERITRYLCAGGLFNPEMMEHDKVRDLLIDCRTALSTLRTQLTNAEAREKVLREALTEMLQWFGSPKPIEWATDEAFKKAKAVEARALAALNPKD